MRKPVATLISSMLLLGAGGGVMAGIYIGGNGNVGSMSPGSGYVFQEEDVSTLASWGAANIGFVGYDNAIGIATFTIDGGSVFTGNPNSLGIGEQAGVYGSMSVTGSGSEYNVVNSALTVGGSIGSGTGSLGVYDSGYVRVTTLAVGDAGTGTVTVDGWGTSLLALEAIVGGSDGGSGRIEVRNSGLFTVGYANDLTLNQDGGAGTSSIDLMSGGGLRLSGNYSDLTSFLGSIVGTPLVRYWDGDQWVDVTSGTQGVDYNLFQNGGYTTLYQGAVPEPSTIALLLGGALLIVAKRLFFLDA